MEWLFLIGFGIMMFLLFGLEPSIKVVMDGKIKIAEASARAEEARLERARIEMVNR